MEYSLQHPITPYHRSLNALITLQFQILLDLQFPIQSTKSPIPEAGQIDFKGIISFLSVHTQFAPRLELKAVEKLVDRFFIFCNISINERNERLRVR